MKTHRGKYRNVTDASPIGRAIDACDVYRVRTVTSYRRLVPKQVARRFWQRTWQVEWDGCTGALRAYTRHGALTRGVRAQLKVVGK